MKLVKLSEKNVSKMLEISVACFGKKYVEKEVKPWYRKKLFGQYRKVHSVLEYYIIFESRMPIGITGFYQLKGDSIFWLGYFGIVPKERRKGLGTIMLLETQKRAKKLGCKIFGAWTTSKRAAKFYESNGFKKGESLKTITVDGRKIYTYPKYSVFYYKKV